MSKLTAGWRWEKIGNFMQKDIEAFKKSTYPKEEFIYIDISSVDTSTKTVSSPKTIKTMNAPSRAKFILKEKDVVISNVRPNLNAVALIDKNFENSVGTSGFTVVRLKGEHDPNFFFYFFTSPYFIDYVGELVQGAMYPAIGDKDVKNCLIPLPEKIEDQTAIARDLQSKLAHVETMRQAALKQKEAAKALQSAILREVFPWQAGESLPSGWKWEKITDISKNLDGKRIPVTEKVRKKGDIPYYGVSGIVDYVQDYLFDEELLLVSEDGANLVMRTYPIAFSISGKTWVNNHAHVLKFEDKNTQKIVQHYINGLDISDYVSGAAQPKLNQENLNRIKIPVPIDANAKLEVVKKIEQTFEISTKMTKQADTQLNAIEALPAAILREAFNFKINEN